MAGSQHDHHGHDTTSGAPGRTLRHAHEAEVYDARADELLATLTEDELRVAADAPPFPNREHVDFLSFALARLGDPKGMRILEVGSGQGDLAIYLGLMGAEVLGIDVSEGNVRLAQRKAQVSDADDVVRFAAEPIESLAEPDDRFDAVIGNQVLHHVELTEAMPNIRRMLRPGGRAVFCEPVLFVPDWLRRARNSAPVTRVFPSRADTPDERAISLADLATMADSFDGFSVRPFQLTCRLQNFVELSDGVFHRLERFDQAVLARVRTSRRLCRYVVATGEVAPAA